MVLDLDGDDLAPVVAAMADLAAAGRGWINLTPAGVDPAPPQSVWGRINGRGPDVPRITWTAPGSRRGAATPAELGIEHAAGGKALAHLAEAGCPLPDGWGRLQDHAMRGLVVVPPPTADHDAVVRWALRATEALTGWAADGRWRAQVFDGS